MLEPRIGWHGKLPSLGDFATRRLDTVFLDRWDTWISTSLGELQKDPQWLDRYLHCPAWRFLLMPGVIDSRAWCGVLMPSVDRVGRYYPLTFALPLEGHLSLQELQPTLEWLGHLEQSAYCAVDNEWGIEALEASLLRLGDWVPVGDSSVPTALRWDTHLHAKACWYAAPVEGKPRLLVSSGLEAGDLPRLLFAPG